MSNTEPSVAVIIPCYNEAVSIAKVIADFKNHLPAARIYVYNNNSTDDTAAIAAAAGAMVRHVVLPGKGNVVRRMFADVEADVYVMVDGDDTYDAASAPKMIEMLVEDGFDMVVGTRDARSTAAYRSGHVLGNRLFTNGVRLLFGQAFSDILSGYRVFSKRFVKSFPARSRQFETETELTIHALQMRLPCSELSTPYFERGEGSHSKLSTWVDGYKILRVILSLVLSERPLLLFGSFAALLFAVAVLLVAPVLSTYLAQGTVPRFPTLIVACSLAGGALLTMFFGYLYEMISLSRRETKRFFYMLHRSSRKQD